MNPVDVIPNPEYETAPFEGICLDKNGARMSDMISAMMFGRARPPRYKQLDDGSYQEVPSHIANPKQ